MKIPIIIVTLLVALALGAFLVINNQDEAKTTPSTQASNQAEQPSSQAPEDPQPTSDTEWYTDYTPEAISNSAGKKVVIFFHADWCPNCRALEKTLLAGTAPEDIVLLKADYDTETELRKQYGVTQQTTMVYVDEQGNKVKLWVANAFDDIEDIKEQLL